jgi:hypothetical protein
VSPDDETQPPRPKWAQPRPPRDPAPPKVPEGDPQQAEQRMREEMGRQKRQEEAQLKTLKFGCVGLLVALVLAMVVAFFF